MREFRGTQSDLMLERQLEGAKLLLVLGRTVRTPTNCNTLVIANEGDPVFRKEMLDISFV